MKKEKVFITGADGLLGSHVVRELTARQYLVKALVEPEKKTNTIHELNNVELCYGNILDRDSVEKESYGCDYIIHAAASTAVFPSRNKQVNEINIKGTKHIIHAALKNKIKRVIHVGSANSFGFGSLEFPGNETTPFNCDKFSLDYINSKYEAHQLVLKAVRQHQLPALVVCPTFMLGRYDSKPGSGALIASLYNKSIPGYSSGGKNYIHVNDVAVAIANAIHMGRIGESYILGHQNLDYKEAFELIAKTIGVNPPSVYLPKWVTVTYGAINELACKAVNKTPKVSLAIARIGNHGFYYDSSKAINELWLPQTPINIAVKECFEWLSENNLLHKS